MFLTYNNSGESNPNLVPIPTVLYKAHCVGFIYPLFITSCEKCMISPIQTYELNKIGFWQLACDLIWSIVWHARPTLLY